MGYSAQIIADSANPCGDRLTTFEITYPRFIHAELMTHRKFSRSSASSRAIPVKKMISRVLKDPAQPVWWGQKQAGMQARSEVSGWKRQLGQALFYGARYAACLSAHLLDQLGLHKQIVNRLIEPWAWITAIVSATDYSNFFNLRIHPDAQPELRKIAGMMAALYVSSDPEPLKAGEWHLPYVHPVDRESCGLEELKRISTARCARVSYLTHAGMRSVSEDLRLYDRLVGSHPKHASPTEHVAMALSESAPCGNFVGWKQHRKEIPDESASDFDFNRLTIDDYAASGALPRYLSTAKVNAIREEESSSCP